MRKKKRLVKNSPFKICCLVGLVILILLPLQWCPLFTIGGFEVRHVGLLTDVLPKKWLPKDVAQSLGLETEVDELPKVKPAFVDSCPSGMVCIEDYADSTQRGMRPFYEALSKVKTLNRPVRIAYFGDSFIECDIFTSDLRALLQEHFGGQGVGWLDMHPPYAKNRITVRQSSGGWSDFCVLDKGKYNVQNLSVGQRYFIPRGTAWTEIHGVDRARWDTTEVHTLYLRTNAPSTIGLQLNGGSAIALHPKGTGHVEAVSYAGRAGSVRWKVPPGGNTICWGVAEEGRRGVSLDNFSLRGSSGTTMAEIPEQNLTELNAVREYDLIVLQFGLNVANKKQTDYSNYTKQMQGVVEKMKKCFPHAGILIVGIGDREDRMADGKLHTMRGVKALSRYQQNLAADCGVAFWNLYEAMGGEGSMVKMVEAKPAEAGKDYTHINMLGGKRLAGILYKSLLHGYNQNEKRKAYEAQ